MPKLPTMTPAQAAALAREVVRTAEVVHLKYPQYEGHWRTPDWRPVRLKKRVRSKMGVAFEPGDVTVARRYEREGPLGGILAYSFRNRIDTAVNPAHVEWF